MPPQLSEQRDMFDPQASLLKAQEEEINAERRRLLVLGRQAVRKHGRQRKAVKEFEALADSAGRMVN
jgi:hypothetical protein